MQTDDMIVACNVCGKADDDHHKKHECDCARCASCGQKLGDEDDKYLPGKGIWVEGFVALYPWRGEYWCDGCLDEEFAMMRLDEKEGIVTMFFEDEYAMPDDLV